MLKEAAQMGDSYCEGVSCATVPFTDPKVKSRTRAEIVKIISAGGAVVLDAKSRTADDLTDIATACADNGLNLVLTNVDDKSTDELAGIADAGKGNVVFELDRCFAKA
jgi:hypothetical protein